MPFAAALSEHPDPAIAFGEAAGKVLEQLGADVDLALLFVTSPHAEALGEAAAAVRNILRPNVLVGAAAVSVVGTSREVEERPGLTLWAGRFGGGVLPLELTASRIAPDEVELSGWPAPEDIPFEPSALLLIGDPYSFPAEAFFDFAAEQYPRLPVIGGMASGARTRGGTRLLVDDRIVTSGAVGALLGPGVDVESVVSQGCRPIGEPWAVTAAEGNVVHLLAGKPPLERLVELAKDALTDDEVTLVNQGALHIGRVIDESKAEFAAGDFLVRNVLGGDRTTGAIALADRIDIGTTVQFHLRDAAAASAELRAMLRGRRADAALVFTCNGRGVFTFGVPDHDASVVEDELGAVPVAGFFAAGEFGPVGGRNFVHGFTASIALLRERR